jgi:hypothetical protein
VPAAGSDLPVRRRAAYASTSSSQSNRLPEGSRSDLMRPVSASIRSHVADAPLIVIALDIPT